MEKRKIAGGIASLVVGAPLFFSSFGNFRDFKYAMNKVRDNVYSNVEFNGYESVRAAEERVRGIEDRFFYDKLFSGEGMGIGAGLPGIGYVCLGRKNC